MTIPGRSSDAGPDYRRTKVCPDCGQEVGVHMAGDEDGCYEEMDPHECEKEEEDYKP